MIDKKAKTFKRTKYGDANFKYVSRHEHKNGKEDILKAIQNLEFILERDYD